MKSSGVGVHCGVCIAVEWVKVVVNYHESTVCYFTLAADDSTAGGETQIAT